MEAEGQKPVSGIMQIVEMQKGITQIGITRKSITQISVTRKGITQIDNAKRRRSGEYEFSDIEPRHSDWKKVSTPRTTSQSTDQKIRRLLLLFSRAPSSFLRPLLISQDACLRFALSRYVFPRYAFSRYAYLRYAFYHYAFLHFDYLHT